MTEKKYTIGDYTNCRYDICEILEDDEVYCIVGTEYADKIIKVLEENEQLKSEIEKLSYANEDLLTQKRNWEKLSDEYAKVYEENEQLKKENKTLADGLTAYFESKIKMG